MTAYRIYSHEDQTTPGFRVLKPSRIKHIFLRTKILKENQMNELALNFATMSGILFVSCEALVSLNLNI